MDEVRELAHTSPDATRRFTIGDSQSFAKSTTFGVAPHKSPERKSLAGSDDDAVHMRCSQSQVYGFVFLQLHVDVAQPTSDKRAVLIDENWQRFVLLLAGKMLTAEQVFHFALQDVLLHSNAIGEGREF